MTDHPAWSKRLKHNMEVFYTKSGYIIILSCFLMVAGVLCDLTALVKCSEE